MSYFEPKGTSLNIATNTQELRKLIIENPDLPLLVFVGEEAYLEDGRHYWMCCSGCHAELGEFLDCGVTEGGGGSVFIDRDKLYDTIYDYYYEEPSCRDCPYDGVNCKDKLKSDALTLIVQLKAIGNEEARKLKKVVLSQQQTINALLGFE